jgi:hypothetical protein
MQRLPCRIQPAAKSQENSGGALDRSTRCRNTHAKKTVRRAGPRRSAKPAWEVEDRHCLAPRSDQTKLYCNLGRKARLGTERSEIEARRTWLRKIVGIKVDCGSFGDGLGFASWATVWEIIYIGVHAYAGLALESLSLGQCTPRIDREFLTQREIVLLFAVVSYCAVHNKFNAMPPSAVVADAAECYMLARSPVYKDRLGSNKVPPQKERLVTHHSL